MYTKTRRIAAGIVIISLTTVICQCNRVNQAPTEENEAVLADSVIVESNDTSVAEPESVKKQKPLTVTIQNLASSTAPVIISAYGTKNKFPDPKGQLKKYKFKAHGKELTIQIPNLQFGTYALATYQDVNSDGKIDKNMFGVPTEGYGFSNNFRPTIKAPDFDDCSFAYNEKNNALSIKMIQ